MNISSVIQQTANPATYAAKLPLVADQPRAFYDPAVDASGREFK